MPLTLRPAGLSSPAYPDWLDYVIVEDGRDVGERTLPRFRALALFGRRSLQRVARSSLPASENLHRTGLAF